MSQMFEKLFEVTPIAWTALAVVVILSLIGLIMTSRTKTTVRAVHTKKIVYGGICISIAFVLSYIRIFNMPQGGSITLASMLPLVLYSMIFGPTAGIMAGVAYGMLQLIQDMWVVNIWQLLLDYPLAFGCLGLAGLAPKQIKNLYVRTGFSVTIAIMGRCMMHVISGVIFFADYAPEGMNPLLYSTIYNGTFLGVELIITLILSFAILSSPVYRSLQKSAYSASL